MEKQPMLLEIVDTVEASNVDFNMYRLERFSETRNAWLFVKRKGQ